MGRKRIERAVGEIDWQPRIIAVPERTIMLIKMISAKTGGLKMGTILRNWIVSGCDKYAKKEGLDKII